MRIGIISDIHGNLVALDHVLSELSKINSVDPIVCLGDAIATGPRPREVLKRLRSLDIPIVKGNRDEYLLTIRASSTQPHLQKSDYSRRVAEIDNWCKTKLSDDDLNYMRGFPDTITIPLTSNGGGEKLLCFHGSPKSNTDLITSATSDEELALKLDGQTARLMAGGHTHIQMLRRYADVVIVNPGSVGQAFERPRGLSNNRRVPWAEFALIHCDDLGSLQKAELLRKYLDASEILKDAINSGMPQGEWWAGRK
jgi:putative phosphoesterase